MSENHHTALDVACKRCCAQRDHLPCGMILQSYQAGTNAVVSNPGVLYKSRAEDGDDVDVLKMAGELAVASQWGCDRSHFIADEDYCNRQ